MSRREENIENAKNWNKAISVNKIYSSLISKSIEGTQVRKHSNFTPDEVNKIKSSQPHTANIKIVDCYTYDALIENSSTNHKTCILNFASFFYPGGGYLKGAYAQEESLCHVSGLYQILSGLQVYKERSIRKHIPEVYASEYIYSPSVPFTREKGKLTTPVCVDVLSCAAPNCNRVSVARINEIKTAIEERLKVCYLLPYLNGCDTIILGAWGCGAFKNDPVMIAEVFNELNIKYGNLYHKVIYAVPNGVNREVFMQTMKSE